MKPYWNLDTGNDGPFSPANDKICAECRLTKLTAAFYNVMGPDGHPGLAEWCKECCMKGHLSDIRQPVVRYRK